MLEVPTSILRDVRVPRMRDLPPGPLAMTRLDTLLMERGLVTAEQLRDKSEDEGLSWEERWTPTLAESCAALRFRISGRARSSDPARLDRRRSPALRGRLQ